MISYTSLFNKTVCIHYNARYTRSKSTNKITINKLIENKDSIQLTIGNVKKNNFTRNYFQWIWIDKNARKSMDHFRFLTHYTNSKKVFRDWMILQGRNNLCWLISAMARKGLTITLIWIVLMTSGGFINNTHTCTE